MATLTPSLLALLLCVPAVAIPGKPCAEVTSDAFHQGETAATMIYGQIVREVHALEANPDATQYFESPNETRPINQSRLREILSIYLERQHRSLGYAEILMHHFNDPSPEAPHAGLLDAIQTYLGSPSHGG